MKTTPGYIAYVRVSTQRQGEHGTSLEAQRDAITAYAQRKGLLVDRWVEERETAAKTGRPQFEAMLRHLDARKAAGLILHKIDRGARNLEDWTALQRLVDRDVNVLFATEDIDLRSVSGRLSADVQAVVAAHYIRNLRQEALKGINARLKQGIYPFRAPVGYLDCGAGKPKEPDPATAPFIRRAFELYDDGRWGLVGLREQLELLGLRNRQGRPVSLSGLSTVLRNPFYTGLIRMQRSGETYAGAHAPLITTALFERVQARMDGKLNGRLISHDFLFRRLLRCGPCGYRLIGERQKGRVYYRCHTRTCSTTGVREDAVERVFQAAIAPLTFSKSERDRLEGLLDAQKRRWSDEARKLAAGLQLQQERVGARLSSLTDALIDGLIDRESFNHRKEALLMEQGRLRDRVASKSLADVPGKLREILELAETASNLYGKAKSPDRRDLVETLTSNLGVSGKKIDVMLAPPFSTIANRHRSLVCGPCRGDPRTLQTLFDSLTEFVEGMKDEVAVQIGNLARTMQSRIPRGRSGRSKPETA